jgi:hypothetical protein
VSGEPAGALTYQSFGNFIGYLHSHFTFWDEEGAA